MPRSQLLASNSGCPVHSGSSSFAALYRCRGVVDFCQGLGAVGVSRCWLQTVVVLFTLDLLLSPLCTGVGVLSTSARSAFHGAGFKQWLSWSPWIFFFRRVVPVWGCCRLLPGAWCGRRFTVLASNSGCPVHSGSSFAALGLGVVAFPLTSCQFWRSKMAVAGDAHVLQS